MSQTDDRLLVDTTLPQAVPRVDLPIIQVVLLAGVENKLSFMSAVFLRKTDKDEETVRNGTKK